MALPLLGHLTDIEPYVYHILHLYIELSRTWKERESLVGFKSSRSLAHHFPFLPFSTLLSPFYSPIFPAASLLAAQYELVKKTNMVDYAQQLFETINPGAEAPAGSCFFPSPSSTSLSLSRAVNRALKWLEADSVIPLPPYVTLPSADLASRREEVAAKNTSLAAAAEQVLDVISKPEVAGQLKQDKDQNLIWLKENYQVSFGRELLGLDWETREGGREGRKDKGNELARSKKWDAVGEEGRAGPSL